MLSGCVIGLISGIENLLKLWNLPKIYISVKRAKNKYGFDLDRTLKLLGCSAML